MLVKSCPEWNEWNENEVHLSEYENDNDQRNIESKVRLLRFHG